MTVDDNNNRDDGHIISVPTVALLAALQQASAASSAQVTTSSFFFPTVVVSSTVSQYLCRGAHLMKAGMDKNCLLLPSVQALQHTHGAVAIVVRGNPQPFAVGRLTNNTSSSSGIGVEIWTCFGDDLWKQQQQQAHGNSKDNDGKKRSAEGIIMNPIGGAPYDNGNYGNVGFVDGKVVRPIVVIDDVANDDENQEQEDGAIASASREPPLSDATATVERTLTESNDHQEAHPSANDDDDNDDDDKNPPINPDEMFHQAVCDALVNIQDSDLPMTTANLYAQHVKPRLNNNASMMMVVVDVRQTSWKKLNRYLQYQQDVTGLLTCKAHGTDPMGYLTAINRTHEDLRGRKRDVRPLVQKKTKLATVNLYVVPNHFVSLLRLDPNAVKAVHAKSEERRGTGMLTAPEVRAILDQYVTDNELCNASSKQTVHLDGPLTDALFKRKGASSSSSPPPPTSLSRKDLYNEWIAKMEPAHALVEMPGNRVCKLGRGRPPKVTIEVSLRQGRARKYSTRVRGLEDYDIDPVAFSKDVTKRFACAGTVESNPQGRAALKKGRVELDFQGHLVEELQALLLGDETLSSHGGAKDSNYCIPKSAIEVVLKKKVPSKKPKK